MTRLPELLRQHAAREVTTLCQCWQVRRADGRVLGFTDHDAVIRFDGLDHRPQTGFSASEATRSLGLAADATDIVPLWDSNADSFVRWTRAGTIEYVWLFHDDPKWILIARSEQGVMAELWQQWAEFQESDEECLRFADAIGFRYAEEGLKIIENDSDTINRWRLELTD